MVTDIKHHKHVLIGALIGGVLIIPTVGIWISIFSAIIVFGIGWFIIKGFKND